MIFTEKIFKNQIDEDVHKQLTRFSKGTFENRATIKINVVKDKLKVNTSYDLMKDLTIAIAKNFDKIKVSGKTFNGKKKEEVIEEISGEELLELCKSEYVLLNLNFKEYSMKVGKSLPKPGNKLKENFCKCIFPLSILNEITDEKDFKKLLISYTFVIEEIIIPEEYKNDFQKARIHSKRKGKLIKNMKIDGNESKKEINFEA